MRFQRLLPLALPLSLLAAAPAFAADQDVSVNEFDFKPGSVRVEPGETVTWNFNGNPAEEPEHTSTSMPGQPDSWNSRLKAPGTTYSRVFSKPGRYQYFCQPHPNMVGVVQVGSDTVRKSFRGAKARGGRRAIKLTLTMAEDAKVTLSVKGASRKRVTKSLKKGKRSITLKRLKAGRYSVSFVGVDAFDKKTSGKGSATVTR
jgi:plastocyanin